MSQAHGEFVPTCPGCKYDLRGSPDGRCPECGRGFTHRELWLAHVRSRERSNLGMGLSAASWGVAIVAHCGGTCMVQANEAGIVFISVCAFMVETLLARAAARDSEPAGLIAGVPPVLHGVLGVIVVSTYQSVILTLASACFALAMLSLIPRVSDRVGLALRAGLVLSIGCATTALFVLGWGEVPWRWWLGGQTMTPGEEMTLGAGFLMAAGVVAWLIRKQKVRGA